MIIFSNNKISNEEEEYTLSLFRIPVTFFSSDDDDDNYDDDDDHDNYDDDDDDDDDDNDDHDNDSSDNHSYKDNNPNTNTTAITEGENSKTEEGDKRTVESSAEEGINSTVTDSSSANESTDSNNSTVSNQDADSSSNENTNNSESNNNDDNSFSNEKKDKSSSKDADGNSSDDDDYDPSPDKKKDESGNRNANGSDDDDYDPFPDEKKDETDKKNSDGKDSNDNDADPFSDEKKDKPDKKDSNGKDSNDGDYDPFSDEKKNRPDKKDSNSKDSNDDDHDPFPDEKKDKSNNKDDNSKKSNDEDADAFPDEKKDKPSNKDDNSKKSNDEDANAFPDEKKDKSNNKDAGKNANTPSDEKSKGKDDSEKKSGSDGKDNIDKKNTPDGKGNPASEAAANLAKAKNTIDGIKNAAENPADAAEKLGTEGAKLAARAAGDAIAPGAGKVAEKAVDVADKIVGSTETGKKLKKGCCIGCIGCSCLSALLSVCMLFLPIIILVGAWSLIWDGDDKEPNFVQVMQNDIKTSKNIVNILNDSLKEVKYGTDDEYFSATAFYLIEDNYSVFALKKSATKKMDGKHIPIFEEILNDNDTIKSRFNNDEVDKLVNNTTNILDKQFTVFNPSQNLQETVSLRDLFNGISTTAGDDTYDVNIVNSILSSTKNLEIRESYETMRENLTRLEILTYLQAIRQYDEALTETKSKIAGYSSYGLKLLDDYTDEFFLQYSVIPNILTYMTLSNTCDEPSVIYEIACENIKIYSEPFDYDTLSVDTDGDNYNDITYAYFPRLETWYEEHTFKIELYDISQPPRLIHTGSGPRGLDTNSYSSTDTLLDKYNIEDKEGFFALFQETTGIDPVEGEDNIYSLKTAGQNGLINTSTHYTTKTLPMHITMGFNNNFSDEFTATYGVGKTHLGIDYAPINPSLSVDVLAIEDGTVIFSGWHDSYGNYVKIQHPNGYYSIYAHGNQRYVTSGQHVSKGERLMEMGTTGASSGKHLHLEVREPNNTTRVSATSVFNYESQLFNLI